MQCICREYKSFLSNNICTIKGYIPMKVATVIANLFSSPGQKVWQDLCDLVLLSLNPNGMACPSLIHSAYCLQDHSIKFFMLHNAIHNSLIIWLFHVKKLAITCGQRRPVFSYLKFLIFDWSETGIESTLTNEKLKIWGKVLLPGIEEFIDILSDIKGPIKVWSKYVYFYCPGILLLKHL
jgi:hypothetical protein